MNDIVRTLRQDRGLTQLELAERAGTSQPTVAAYESGAKSPTLHTLRKLARAASAELVMRAVPALTREDRRSLAWHEAVARKLREHPDATLAVARSNLSRWTRGRASGRALLARWETWVTLPVPDLILLMLDSGPVGREMRQVSPFAGVLSAPERADVLTRFRDSEAA